MLQRVFKFPSFFWFAFWNFLDPFFFFFLIDSSTVDLQCCVNFCCTVKWLSFIHTHIHTHTHTYVLCHTLFRYVYHRISNTVPCESAVQISVPCWSNYFPVVWGVYQKWNCWIVRWFCVSFFEKTPSVFHSSCSIFCSYQPCPRVSISSYPHQHLFIFWVLVLVCLWPYWCVWGADSVFFLRAILVGV